MHSTVCGCCNQTTDTSKYCYWTMTEVLSALFGRKKPKGPAPVPSAAQTTQPTTDDFVMVPKASDPPYPVNNLYPNPNDSQSGDYESLFSFLKVQPGDSANGLYRPARPAPPVPASFGAGNTPLYGLQPSEGSRSTGDIPLAAESQTIGWYLSGIPFQISKSLGGGTNMMQLKSELTDVMNRVKAPNLGEYDYSFNLEEQVLREISN
ncbi:hypothetical protein CHUAL_013076 [Chamberlinius hualienensis]